MNKVLISALSMGLLLATSSVVMAEEITEINDEKEIVKEEKVSENLEAPPIKNTVKDTEVEGNESALEADEKMTEQEDAAQTGSSDLEKEVTKEAKQVESTEEKPEISNEKTPDDIILMDEDIEINKEVDINAMSYVWAFLLLVTVGLLIKGVRKKK